MGGFPAVSHHNYLIKSLVSVAALSKLGLNDEFYEEDPACSVKSLPLNFCGREMIHLALFSMLELALVFCIQIPEFPKRKRGLKELIGIIEIVKDPEEVSDRHEFHHRMQNEMFQRAPC